LPLVVRVHPRKPAYGVKITRSVYTPSAKLNARGRYATVPYEPDSIDFFFITTGDNRLYLVPLDVVLGLSDLILTSTYAAFEATHVEAPSATVLGA
jgi:hypothetical protein